MAKIAHKIPEKCVIFHIIIFSDITTVLYWLSAEYSDGNESETGLSDIVFCLYDLRVSFTGYCHYVLFSNNHILSLPVQFVPLMLVHSHPTLLPEYGRNRLQF